MVQTSVLQPCLWQVLIQFEVPKHDYVAETKDPTKKWHSCNQCKLWLKYIRALFTANASPSWLSHTRRICEIKTVKNNDFITLYNTLHCVPIDFTSYLHHIRIHLDCNWNINKENLRRWVNLRSKVTGFYLTHWTRRICCAWNLRQIAHARASY